MIVVGHSHIVCVAQAATEVGAPLHVINIKSIPRRELTAGADLSPQFLEKLQGLLRQDGSGHLFSLMGGTVHTALGLLRHEQPFDFVLPSRPDIPLVDGCELIPYGALRDAMRRKLRFDLSIVERMKRQLGCEVVHFDAPPPALDPEFIRATIWKGLTERLRNAGIGPATVRLKLWLLQSEIVQKACEEMGVEFVPAPAIAVDDDGFLSPAYRQDASHGNIAFGRLLLKGMQRYVEGVAPVPAGS
jgi:hypothetical protein